jgi:hypothetical protein
MSTDNYIFLEGFMRAGKRDFFRPLQYALYRPSGATGSKEPQDFDRGKRLVDKGIFFYFVDRDIHLSKLTAVS